MKNIKQAGSVEVAPKVRLAIERASRSGGGEVCGLLMQDQNNVQQFCLVRNISPDNRSFLLDELDFERVLRRGAETGLKPIAFLHTHTTTPELSKADREGQPAIRLPWVVVVVPRA